MSDTVPNADLNSKCKFLKHIHLISRRFANVEKIMLLCAALHSAALLRSILY